MGSVFFRALMAVFVGLYRISGGRIGGRMVGLPVLVLSTTGRRTGKQRSTPLAYLEKGDAYVIIASNGGSDSHPGWFHNLMSNPDATVQIGARKISVRASVTAPEERERLWKRLVELSPGYDTYTRRTRREIPMVILRPVAG